MSLIRDARQTGSVRNQHYPSNRAPLVPSVYVPLPLGSVKPSGWLRGQLEGWASGMTGQLDEVWPDVGRDNGWLGGDGDVWERGPYWLDGLVPLAWTLQDHRLIEKAQRWIDATLDSTRPDGFFGPGGDHVQRGSTRAVPGEDWWPRMVMLKVLQQYHEATSDGRVLELMTNYFRLQHRELPAKPLDHYTFWGQRRGGENLASIHWLYNRTGEESLLDLGELVFQQTEDWARRFTTDQGIWHVVNTAMGIKQPGIWYQQSGEEHYLEAIEQGLHYLMTSHGQVEGIWSGDEMLHGTDPTQGVETCAVVEYMFSLESLLPITGSVRHADRLERVAYNALPAALSPRFVGRHYYQCPNQIACWRQATDVARRTCTRAGRSSRRAFGWQHPTTDWQHWCTRPVRSARRSQMARTFGSSRKRTTRSTRQSGSLTTVRPELRSHSTCGFPSGSTVHHFGSTMQSWTHRLPARSPNFHAAGMTAIASSCASLPRYTSHAGTNGRLPSNAVPWSTHSSGVKTGLR